MSGPGVLRMSGLLACPRGPYGSTGLDEVAVVDTETTGLWAFGLDADGKPSGDPHGPDRICTVAAGILRCSGGVWQLVDEAFWIMDPMRPVNDGAAKLNGLARVLPGEPVPAGRRNLHGLAPFGHAAPSLLAFTRGLPLVCHNAVFDIAMLDAELVRAGLAPLGNRILCTKGAFAEMQGLGRPERYVPNTSLNALCDFLEVDRSTRFTEEGTELHGASVDMRLAAQCFTVLEPCGWMLLEAAEGLPHRRNGLLAARGASRPRSGQDVVPMSPVTGA